MSDIKPNLTEFNINCSFKGCKVKFSKEYYSGGTVLEKDKHFIILDALMCTRLFCMKHCTENVDLICRNSKIKID